MIYRFSLVIILVLSSFLFAQNDEPLVTDRPDATESAVTVGNGTFQIETGFVLEKYESSFGSISETNYNIASTLFRYGIGEDFEVIKSISFVRQRFNCSSELLSKILMAANTRVHNKW